MEERIMSTRPFEVEPIHPFRTGENSVNDYETPTSIRNSPPLTYESTLQHINGVGTSFTHDLPPSRHSGLPSLSAALKIPKLPLNGRSRPLPIPAQPKMSPADGLPAALNPTAAPAIPTNSQRPPVALNIQRSRPLPQPGAPSTLPPSTHLSSSQTSSFLSSSYTSHSRSGSSNSNVPSLCTTASYSYPHSSSSYQTSFARASTLPTIQHPQNQMTQDSLALPKRAETQPSSAPPCQAAFGLVAPIVPRKLQEVHTFNVLNSDVGRTGSVEDGKAEPTLLGAGNKSAAQSEIAVKSQMMDIVTFVLEDSAVLSSTSGIITTATPEIPSLPPLDFATDMSPMPPFYGFKSESLSGKREERTILDQVTDVGNELGLSGMSEGDASNAHLPPDLQLPPPPTTSPPVPPSREIPTRRTTVTMPLPTPVSLKPLNGGPNLKKKNRPVLTVRTWDLDSNKPQSKKEHKRTVRATAQVPNYQKGNELKVPSKRDQVQARTSFYPSVRVSRTMQDNSRASFLPSVGSPPNHGGSSDGALMVPVWGDAGFSRDSMLLGPGIPAHLESTPSRSSGGLATQFKKMKLLHRKSKSITEWTGNGTLNIADGRPEATKSALPNATISQSRSSLFGHRHPYGYQRGAATCSLNSVGASVPTASGSSMVHSAAPRTETLHSTAPMHAPASFLPSHQPKRSPPFRMAPLAPPPPPPEPKKTIGALWTKLRFGTTWKMTGTASRKKNYAVDLW